ncbi:MAG: substrate-binding domain-containing protein [Deltaproteobacteria bacterium]|jgi:tungstate transport system substrate-binding protein|nr:substrate-binding domain-containing protein [Deltaproteobacteria bacterium]
MRALRFLILLALLAFPSAVLAAEELMMATTTSTQDSGLLDYLKPLLLKEAGIDLKWVSTGTGKALEHGKNCDVDVLLVHAPAAELKMVEEGFAVDRRPIMYNDFVLVGPKSDPAGIRGKSVADALKVFSDKKIVFVSRGDKSGTHQTEQGLWSALKMPVPDKESWYVQLGQGMMATINAAAEKNGYTLTDRGTWIKFEAVRKEKNPLAVLVEGDKILLNQYSIMIVNPARCPGVKAGLAKKFADWWVCAPTQNHIAAFKLEGKQLFFPNAAPPSR